MEINGLQSGTSTLSNSLASPGHARRAGSEFAGRLDPAVRQTPDARDLVGGRLPGIDDVLGAMRSGLDGARSGIRNDGGSLDDLGDGLAGIGAGAVIGCLVGGAATGGPGCLPGAAAGAEASTIAAAIVAFFKAIGESLSGSDEDEDDEKKPDGTDDGKDEDKSGKVKGQDKDDDNSICEPPTPWEGLRISATGSPGVTYETATPATGFHSGQMRGA